MQLFHWRSKALQNYSLGDLVVCAENIEQAREKLRASFDAYLRAEPDYLFYLDDTEDLDRLKALFEADLAAAPRPTPFGALYIPGGE